MISETFFSNHYASIWKTLTPAMEDFVRRMNMDGYEREWAPIPNTSRADHRGVINEAGFRAFCEIAKRTTSTTPEGLLEAVDLGFELSQHFIYGEMALELGFVPTEEERTEAANIARRLHQFFRTTYPRHKIILNPEFSGSGIVSRCRGDILVENKKHLYEVKSGDRSFRSVDYRQLCVYAALYYSEHGAPFNSIGLLNPRRGVTVTVGIEDFALQIAGQSAASLFQSIIECFSGNLVSN